MLTGGLVRYSQLLADAVRDIFSISALFTPTACISRCIGFYPKRRLFWTATVSRRRALEKSTKTFSPLWSMPPVSSLYLREDRTENRRNVRFADIWQTPGDDRDNLPDILLLIFANISTSFFFYFILKWSAQQSSINMGFERRPLRRC